MTLQNKRELTEAQESLKRALAYEFLSQIHLQLVNKKWSQRDLASKLGTSEQYVSKVFNAASNLTVESMILWADAVDLMPTVVAYPKEAAQKAVHGFIDASVFSACWEFLDFPTSCDAIEGVSRGEVDAQGVSSSGGARSRPVQAPESVSEGGCPPSVHQSMGNNSMALVSRRVGRTRVH